jgi:hypothetical protein
MKQKVSSGMKSSHFDLIFSLVDSDRIAEYDMKLMDIDSDSLQIPDTDYDARVTMPSSEFSRIVRDLSLLGESVRIEVSKEGARFASDGEAANGNVLLKHTEAARERYANFGKEKEEDGEEGDEEDGKAKKANVKNEKVKNEDGAADVEMEEDNNDAEDFKPKSDGEGEEENQDDEDESPSRRKRKKASGQVRSFSPHCRLLTSLTEQAIEKGQEVERRRRHIARRSEHRDEPARHVDFQSQISRQLLQKWLPVHHCAINDE